MLYSVFHIILWVEGQHVIKCAYCAVFIHVFVYHNVYITCAFVYKSFEYIPRNRIAGSYCNSMLKFVKSAKLITITTVRCVLSNVIVSILPLAFSFNFKRNYLFYVYENFV